MKTLCTFSGKFGDILLSLPTAREIGLEKYLNDKYENEKVDFGIMPAYESLLPLLNAQPCINHAFVIKDWQYQCSPHGDQPWEAPVPEGYDKVYHLTYRNHPSKDQPLIDFIAAQQRIKLENPIPFISLPYFPPPVSKYFVAYAFNESMIDPKMEFLKLAYGMLPEVDFINIAKSKWEVAVATLLSAGCLAFIGCRSANYVLACGVGQRVFVYEPNVARSKFGPWGTTFTCPYANETEVNPYAPANSLFDMVKEIKSKAVEVK
jgi:hypothetical protein